LAELARWIKGNNFIPRSQNGLHLQ